MVDFGKDRRLFEETQIGRREIVVSMEEIGEIALTIESENARADAAEAQARRLAHDLASLGATRNEEQEGFVARIDTLERQTARLSDQVGRLTSERDYLIAEAAATAVSHEVENGRRVSIAMAVGRALALARGFNPNESQVAEWLVCGEKIKAVGHWRAASRDECPVDYRDGSGQLGLAKAKEDVETIGYRLLGPAASPSDLAALGAATQDAPLWWDGLTEQDLIDADPEGLLIVGGRQALAQAARITETELAIVDDLLGEDRSPIIDEEDEDGDEAAAEG